MFIYIWNGWNSQLRLGDFLRSFFDFSLLFWEHCHLKCFLKTKHFKIFKIVTNQNELKSVVFVMYNLITWIICWKTIANVHDFYSLHL